MVRLPATEKVLSELVNCVYETIPFYQKLGSIPVDFSQVPIVTKKDIIQDPTQFHNLQILNNEKVIKERTSGTSGELLEIYKTISERNATGMTAWQMRTKWYGVSPRDKFYRFGGYEYIDGIPTASDVVYQDDQNCIEFSVMNLSNAKFDLYIREIQKGEGTWFFSIPSATYLLATYILENRITDLGKVKYIELVGEKVFDYQIDEIQKAFQCPVGAQYGAREVWAISQRCPHGVNHVVEKNVYVETVDQTLALCHEQEGYIVVTSLTSRAMPFLRYMLGDTVTLGHSTDCPCGLSGQILIDIKGRTSEYVLIDDSKVSMMWFYYTVLRFNALYDNGIKQYRIVENKLKDFTYIVVLRDSRLVRELECYLKEEFDRVFNGVTVRIQEEKAIAFTGNKYKHFVSKVK